MLCVNDAVEEGNLVVGDVDAEEKGVVEQKRGDNIGG